MVNYSNKMPKIIPENSSLSNVPIVIKKPLAFSITFKVSSKCLSVLEAFGNFGNVFSSIFDNSKTT